MQHRSMRLEAGFGLIEVLAASALLVTIALGVAQVVAAAVRVSHQARVRTMATMVGGQKMEQLKSLPFGHVWVGDPAISIPSADLSTDLSTDPPGDSGPGLRRSPAQALTTSVMFYADYLDALGRWVGRGTSVPPGAVYTRRWAVVPLPADPDNVLVLHVLVTTIGGDESRFVALKARRP